jgi:hypothetical protein
MRYHANNLLEIAMLKMGGSLNLGMPQVPLVPIGLATIEHQPNS